MLEAGRGGEQGGGDLGNGGVGGVIESLDALVTAMTALYQLQAVFPPKQGGNSEKKRPCHHLRISPWSCILFGMLGGGGVCRNSIRQTIDRDRAYVETRNKKTMKGDGRDFSGFALYWWACSVACAVCPRLSRMLYGGVFVPGGRGGSCHVLWWDSAATVRT